MSKTSPWDDLLSRWEALCVRENRDVPAREVWPDGSPAELAELERLIQRQRDIEVIRDWRPPQIAALSPIDARMQLPQNRLPYQLDKQLGKGGYGEVWKATVNGYPRAIKFVDLAGEAGAIETRALEIIREIHHPHLITLFTAWREGNRLFIEMELADRSLWDCYEEVTKQGKAGIVGEELLRYLDDAARGIDYLNEPRHVLGGNRVAVVHRDIKPQNILLIGDSAKVADFGLVRALERTHTGHSGLMTLPYAAPESFRGETHIRSDQYSLAVTYCKLRGGDFPIKGNTPEEWVQGHLHTPPDLTMLPEEERAVVATALAKEPGDRWTSCQEFVRQLKGAREPALHVEVRHPSRVFTPTLSRPSRYFTGRREELERLRRAFTERADGVGPEIQILSGQGGNGKTQLALEYVRRHRDAYGAVFWVRAGSPAECVTGCVGIARQLGLPGAEGAEQDRIVTAVMRWLESRTDWLLVLDNADDVGYVKAFVPRTGRGHVLMTSRAQVFDSLGVRPISVTPFLRAEALEFLLKRTDREDAAPDDRQAAAALCGEVGCLPLALEQVGAYLVAKQSRFQDYLTTYRKLRLKLLGKVPPVHGDYTGSVVTTWRLNFRQVEETARASADLLRVSALLYPEAIPLELLELGAEQLGPALATSLAQCRDEPVALDELLEPLTRYSLIHRDGRARTYSMHLLVQEVLRAAMNRKQTAVWAERVVRATARVFPGAEFPNWPLCERLLHHAFCCTRHVEEWKLNFPEATLLLHRAAEYLRLQGRFEQSELLGERALAIREKALGSDHPDVATSLNDIANLRSDQGRHVEAESLYERALAIREKALGPDHPEVATSLNGMASLRCDQGRYAEAEPLYARALAIREKALGPDDPEVATSLNGLALLRCDQGRYAEAEPLYERTLAISERVQGPDHPDVATSLNNIANLRCDQGRYAEAEPLYERALAIGERVLGPDHPYVAISLNNIALLRCGQGRHAEAEPLYERALAIREKALGPDHPEVATSLNSIANLRCDQGRHAEAEPLYERALAIREKALGPDHPDVASSLNGLASLRYDQGRYAEAEPLYERALAIREKALGPDHPKVANSLNGLASLLRDQGRYAEAEPLYEQARVINEKASKSQ